MQIVVGINPQELRHVADQCRKIQSHLDCQIINYHKLREELHHALKGSATGKFEERFEKWLRQTKDLSEKLKVTATTLDYVAQLADEQVDALRKLTHLHFPSL